MKVLGIETSCDETAAAIVEDGHRMLSNVVASSVDLHKAYGGVVPEIAARSHLESITPVIAESLEQAGCGWSDIDAIAVTYGPGLGGSLLIGVMAAKTLAIAQKKPLYAINHVEAHIYATVITSAGPGSTASEPSSQRREPSLRDAALGAPVLKRSSSSTASSAPRSRLASHQSPVDVKKWKLANHTYTLPVKPPALPLLALIVSGGHSHLVLLKDHSDYEVIGRTYDDAVGEAFDKVAKILGLPYPGGPSISEAANRGDPAAFKLPKAQMSGKYDFSFSGLKTAVLRAAQAATGNDYTLPSSQLPALLTDTQKANIAASFQNVAVETLVDTLEKASNDYGISNLVIAGGVAANQELRLQVSARFPKAPHFTDIKLCTDNAAMIAALAFYKQSFLKATDPYKLDIDPSLSM